MASDAVGAPPSGAVGTPPSGAVRSFDFSITGKVQGVYFRKATQARALELGIFGWVANEPSRKDLVIGHAEGTAESTGAMQHWLSKIGSPTCRIDSAVFANEQTRSERAFASFEVRKPAKAAKKK